MESKEELEEFIDFMLKDIDSNKDKSINTIKYNTLSLHNKFNVILLSRFLECKDAMIKLDKYFN